MSVGLSYAYPKKKNGFMMKNKRIENGFGHSEGEGLYRADFEHSSCGIGFVANLKGRKSHSIITDALGMLACMEHRGGTGFDVKSGDGAGILLQIPHELFKAECLRQAFRCLILGSMAWG